MDTISVLKRLINVRSTPEMGELEIARVIAGIFAEYGLETQLDAFDGIHANVTVHAPSAGSRPGLLFSSHLDVVPPGQAPWTSPPFEAREKDDRVYGRGAADMKGGIAAAVAAICDCVRSGVQLKGDLIFSGTAGEETNSCGAFCYLEKSRPAGIWNVIVAEPTAMEVVNCHRGILWLKITTLGKSVHGSMPHLGINAITAMHRVITELQNMNIDFVPHPQLGGCSMSINTISGGKATNIVPDECTLTVDIRTLPGQQSEAVVAQVQQVLDRLGVADASFKASLAITRNCPALETSADEQFVKSVCTIAGQAAPRPVSYTTDGPYFTQLGPVIILGPGEPQMCHQPDEYVDIAEVHHARQIYSEIIRKLLVD